MLSIQVEIDVGQVWGRSAIDNHFIKNQITRWLVGFVLRLVFAQYNAAQSTSQRECCVTYTIEKKRRMYPRNFKASNRAE